MIARSRLATAQAARHLRIGREFAACGIVRHGCPEYLSGEVHRNSTEGCFSIFKRGIGGLHCRCTKMRLHCCLAKLNLRYNNRIEFDAGDVERSGKAIAAMVGKRLKYRDTSMARA